MTASEIRKNSFALAREAGADNSEMLGHQLVPLYDGAMVAAQADGNRNAAFVAQDMPRGLLDASIAVAGDAHR